MSDESTTLRGEKLSVYVGEELALVLAGFDDNRSARINQVCGRYRAILRDAVPTLAYGEWMLCCDALNGIDLADSAVGFVWAEIHDAIDLDGLDTKWKVDGAALVAVIRALPLAGRWALLDVVDAFWDQSANISDAEVLLRFVGAKIAAEPAT